MKTLILARHAKSDWSHELPDHQRPLNGRGKKDAPAMGSLLHSYGIRPDVVVSSHAVRALTTARIIAEALGHRQEVVVDKGIYLSGVESLLEVIRRLPASAETAMVVGHNPDMEDCLRRLLEARAFTHMPTCGMACLSWSGTWADAGSTTAQLHWFIIPRLIRPE